MVTYQKEEAIELSGLDKPLFESILAGLKGKRIQYPFQKDKMKHTLFTQDDIDLIQKISQHVKKGAYISEAYDYERKGGMKPLYRIKKNYICKSFGVTSKYLDYIVQLLEAEGHQFNKTPYGAIKCYTIEDVEAFKEKMKQLENNDQKIGTDKVVSSDMPAIQTNAKARNHVAIKTDKQMDYITLNVRATRPIREIIHAQEDADFSVEKILEHFYQAYYKKSQDKEVQSDEMMDLFEDVLHFLQTKEKDMFENVQTSTREKDESTNDSSHPQPKEAVKRAESTKRIRYYKETEADMIQSLRAFALENKGNATMNDYIKQKRKPSLWVIVSHFGSWQNALDQADIKPAFYRKLI